MKVYAGVDPLSGRRHDLVEVIPAGKDAGNLAEQARARLLTQLDEKRSPRTKATVAQLMERYLDMLQIEDTTRAGYERLAARDCSAVSTSAQVPSRCQVRNRQ